MQPDVILYTHTHIYIYIYIYKIGLKASQRRRTEAAEMKLLRPLAGYTIYDHKTNDYIRREIQITGTDR